MGATRRPAGDADASKEPVKAGEATATGATIAGGPPSAAPNKLTDLKAAIPPSCFVKSLPMSLLYLALDTGVILACVAAYEYGVSTLAVGTLLHAVAFAVWSAVLGFYMWAMFVVGHDAGHGSFSSSETVNNIVGHFAHGMILVPFKPWQSSHRNHHLYHNSLTQDRSHPWFTPQDWEAASPTTRVFTRSPLALIVGFAVYLYVGEPDGCHVYPLGRMFKSTSDKLWALVSTLVVAGYLALYVSLGMSPAYIVPWLVFHSWLYTVTYLQHHNGEDTKVYADGAWNYLDGALETVDRKYGWPIDTLHHHISDGHIVHHLFFTQIPHYNLMKATAAIRPLLGARFKDVPTPLPFWAVIKEKWFHPHLQHKQIVEAGKKE